MTPHVLTRSLDRSATVFLLIVAGLGVLIPLSNLLLPAGSMFQVPTYLVALFGKYFLRNSSNANVSGSFSQRPGPASLE